jgi:glucose-1-phosphate adenylyltransferase
MDYGPMIAQHADSDADMTVGCIDVPLDDAKGFGVLSVDTGGRVTGFDEKPDEPQSIPGKPGRVLASMGIYVFNTAFLYEQLIKDADSTYSTHDFGKDIIPALIEKYRVHSYSFLNSPHGQAAYWRDVGTIDSFWQANLELIGVLPELNLYDDDWPIWTYQEQLPPAKFIFDDDDRRGMALDSMVSGGCLISGATVRHSLLFSDVRVNSHAILQDVVVLPSVKIGRHCRITRAVIDKGCDLPEGTVIGENPESDAERFYVSPGGVVLVTPEMLGQEIHHVR